MKSTNSLMAVSEGIPSMSTISCEMPFNRVIAPGIFLVGFTSL